MEKVIRRPALATALTGQYDPMTTLSIARPACEYQSIAAHATRRAEAAEMRARAYRYIAKKALAALAGVMTLNGSMESEALR